MIQPTTGAATAPSPRTANDSETGVEVADRRPRFLRWLLPFACASSAPLTGQQQAELKLIAYH